MPSGEVEDDAEAVVGGDAGGAGVDAGEELGGEGGDDEEDGAGAAEAQVAGGEVGPVVEPAGCFPDAFGGGFGDASAPFVAEDEGDGRLGHSGRLGHVTAGGRALVLPRATVGLLFRVDW